MKKYYTIILILLVSAVAYSQDYPPLKTSEDKIRRLVETRLNEYCKEMSALSNNKKNRDRKKSYKSFFWKFNEGQTENIYKNGNIRNVESPSNLFDDRLSIKNYTILNDFDFNYTNAVFFADKVQSSTDFDLDNQLPVEIANYLNKIKDKNKKNHFVIKTGIEVQYFNGIPKSADQDTVEREDKVMIYWVFRNKKNLNKNDFEILTMYSYKNYDFLTQLISRPQDEEKQQLPKTFTKEEVERVEKQVTQFLADYNEVRANCVGDCIDDYRNLFSSNKVTVVSDVHFNRDKVTLSEYFMEVAKRKFELKVFDITSFSSPQQSAMQENLFFSTATVKVKTTSHDNKTEITGNLKYVINFIKNENGEFERFRIERIITGKSPLTKSNKLSSSTEEDIKYDNPSSIKEIKSFASQKINTFFDLLDELMRSKKLSKIKEQEWLAYFDTDDGTPKIGVSNHLKANDEVVYYSPEEYKLALERQDYAKTGVSTGDIYFLDFPVPDISNIDESEKQIWKGAAVIEQKFYGLTDGFCYCDNTIKKVEFKMIYDRGQLSMIFETIYPEKLKTVAIDCAAYKGNAKK